MTFRVSRSPATSNYVPRRTSCPADSAAKVTRYDSAVEDPSGPISPAPDEQGDVPPLTHTTRAPIDLAWATISFLVPTLIALLAKMGSIDLAYHVRAGEQMLDTHVLIRHDTWLFSLPAGTAMDRPAVGSAADLRSHLSDGGLGGDGSPLGRAFRPVDVVRLPRVSNQGRLAEERRAPHGRRLPDRPADARHASATACAPPVHDVPVGARIAPRPPRPRMAPARGGRGERQPARELRAVPAARGARLDRGRRTARTPEHAGCFS